MQKSRAYCSKVMLENIAFGQGRSPPTSYGSDIKNEQFSASNINMLLHSHNMLVGEDKNVDLKIINK